MRPVLLWGKADNLMIIGLFFVSGASCFALETTTFRVGFEVDVSKYGDTISQKIVPLVRTFSHHHQ
jgi:hypothetical protein